MFRCDPVLLLSQWPFDIRPKAAALAASLVVCWFERSAVSLSLSAEEPEAVPIPEPVD